MVNPRVLLPWHRLLVSAVFLLIGVISRHFQGRDSSSTRSVVFFSAVPRSHLFALMNSVANRQIPDVRVGFCSFNTAAFASHSAIWPEVVILKPWKLRDALIICEADVIVSADRIRTLGILLHFSRVTFIDVWHGFGFKGIRRSGFLTKFDEVWVATEAVALLYERQVGISSERVKVTGSIHQELVAQEASRRDSAAGLNDNFSVLIALTWTRSRGTDSWERYELLNHCAELLGLTFSIRLHHLARPVPGFVSKFPHLKVHQELDGPEGQIVLANTDVLITDWSSLAFEFLPLARPVVFVDRDLSRPSRPLVEPTERWGPIISDPSELLSVLPFLFNSQKSSEPDEKTRIAIARYCSDLEAFSPIAQQTGRVLSHLRDKAGSTP